MKTRVLPATDIANISILPENRMKSALRRKRLGGGSFTYDPVRRNETVILNATASLDEPTLFSSLSRPTNEKIISQVSAVCKNSIERKNCVGIARALLAFYDAENVSAQRKEFASVRISSDTKIRYASPFVIFVDNRPYIMFSDMRRSHFLTNEAMHFVHSINHHLIIEADDDYSEVGVLIGRYLDLGGNTRCLEPRYFNGAPKYSFDELNERLEMVQNYWLEVLREREHKNSEARDFDDGLFKSG